MCNTQSHAAVQFVDETKTSKKDYGRRKARREGASILAKSQWLSRVKDFGKYILGTRCSFCNNPSMQGVPVSLSVINPPVTADTPIPQQTITLIGCVVLAVLGITFHAMSDWDSCKRLYRWVMGTHAGRTAATLWEKFWEWGALSWIILGIFLPVGIGAAMEGMYLTGRCLILLASLLGAAKFIHDALAEKKGRQRKSGEETAWIVGMTAAIFVAVTWLFFWMIGVIEWNHEVIVKMTFKESTVLTESRQHHIQWEINRYFLYLKKTGFDLPTDIPALGTTPEHGPMIIGGAQTGPIPTISILIPEDAVKRDDNVRFGYSVYTFNRLLWWPDMLAPSMSREEKQDDEVAAWIMECYFSASYAGHKICEKGTPGYQWLEALWEVREKFGQDYTDGLMCYTATLWRNTQGKYVESFDKFFRYKLGSGESVKGSAPIDEIFKRHGLDISPPW
jgi:hypothetical protein